ncbi:hypothetical protein F5B17DRAFT_436980, partial [Nemania serpens]
HPLTWVSPSESPDKWGVARLLPGQSEYCIKSWTNHRSYPLEIHRQDGNTAVKFLLSGAKTPEIYSLNTLFFENWYKYQEHVLHTGETIDFIQVFSLYIGDAGAICLLHASFKFLPRSRKEVAAFSRTIQPVIGDAQFAIRAAGQRPLPGCANVQDGIAVDIRSLRGARLEKDTVQVAAGERWGSVYEFLKPHGLGVNVGYPHLDHPYIWDA